MKADGIWADDRHGAQNAYDSASKQTLENEFGTTNEDECMIKILEGGTLQETEVGLEELGHQWESADRWIDWGAPGTKK